MTSGPDGGLVTVEDDRDPLFRAVRRSAPLLVAAASIAITKDLYGHLIEGDKRAATAAMSATLLGTPIRPVGSQARS